ncbi:restriction endonuclease subunit S [Escherichia coli]|jgi:type I restriction enzyme S subunit|uniref:restriction endonuclease subunit S n=1 Tax=Escherichia coli TaxID=562 RepID=UPI000BEAA65A|nr:restriction endonuclease subunit S [Escherichia coli]EKR8131971.1 restriction endonuclease subunit S [Escherichia coli]MBB6748953.1 restriction endonuclease subunit S [Escherichia coli]MBB9134948.1 restriction endonuclease subunit S [Escherichia coli]MBI0892202.1 restriction endonuclease subunit S [Escherichia coli]MCK2776500.1 restriction endonuclease subunit S [Escherichia coli]
MVPKGWEQKKLEELCSLDAPITYGVLKPGEYFCGGIPLLQIKDLCDGSVLSNGLHLISPELDYEYRRSRIIKNDILISLVGTIGRVAKYQSSSEANIHRNIGRIRSNQHEYLFHYLRSDDVQRGITDSASGSSQSALNLSTLRSMLILVPPVIEQKKIAKILSTWDKAISVTEKLLTNSQQQKKALMQQLLTGKKRLLDENGLRFSREWQKGSLSVFCNIVKGKALSASELVSGHYPVIAGGKSSPYSHFNYTHENVVTVSASGAYAGYVSYHKCKIWASDCSVISAKEGNLIQYFYQLLLSMQDKIYSLQSGGAQPHIYPKDLDSISILVPDVNEQQKIAAVLSAADAEITTLEKKLACLKEEKKALMQQLLTGKRRVKVEVEDTVCA